MLKLLWKLDFHCCVTGRTDTIFTGSVIMISLLCFNVSWSSAFCSLLVEDTFPSLDHALVLEDEAGVCGYALALSDAKQAAAKVQVKESSRSSRTFSR